MLQNIEIPRSHPAMSCPYISPLSKLIGIPVVVYREAPVASPGQTARERDCQAATYLMIELDTGFAAPEWQGNIGPVRQQDSCVTDAARSASSRAKTASRLATTSLNFCGCSPIAYSVRRWFRSDG